MDTKEHITYKGVKINNWSSTGNKTNWRDVQCRYEDVETFLRIHSLAKAKCIIGAALAYGFPVIDGRIAVRNADEFETLYIASCWHDESVEAGLEFLQRNINLTPAMIKEAFAGCAQ